MERRRILQATGIAGAAALTGLAGCSEVTSVAGEPARIEWEFEWEGFVASGLQPTIVTTGTIRNVGGGSPTFDVYMKYVDGAGESFVREVISIEQLASDEEQQFFSKVSLSRAQVDRFEEVVVSVPAFEDNA